MIKFLLALLVILMIPQALYYTGLLLEMYSEYESKVAAADAIRQLVCADNPDNPLFDCTGLVE